MGCGCSSSPRLWVFVVSAVVGVRRRVRRYRP
ncbi:MAG: hypothetical protein ACQETI_13755 [Halobacteriota archaeon]